MNLGTFRTGAVGQSVDALSTPANLFVYQRGGLKSIISRLSFRHAGLHTQLALRNGSQLFEFLNIIRSAHIFVRITRSD